MRIKKRWGKDLNILWKVTFKDGSAFTSSMKDDLVLEARDARNKLYIIPITSIDEAGIRAKFDGDDHGLCGPYSLTLWYLRGKDGTTCVDLPSAFELVRYTDYESSNNLADMDGDIIVTALQIEYGRTELNELASSIASVRTTANANASALSNLQSTVSNLNIQVQANKTKGEQNASSISSLNTQVASLDSKKVEKVAGKGLSTNDYSNEEKQKVANLQTSVAANTADIVATKNTIEEHEETMDALRDDIDDGFTTLNGNIGNIENLETNSKLDLVAAVNEVAGSVSQNTASINTANNKIGVLESSMRSILIGRASLSLSASRYLFFKGESVGVTISASVSNANANDIDSIVIKKGSEEVKSVTKTNSAGYTEVIYDTTTFNANAVVLGDIIGSSSVTIEAVYPVYCGFGASVEDVVTNGVKLSARTYASGTYSATATANNVSYYILVPSNFSTLSSFTMGGAPYVMTTSTTTINGVNYRVYKSGGVYNTGASVTINAN